MVVYAKNDELKGQYDEEIVVMLQDWLHIPALDLLTQTMENKLYIIPAATFFGPQIPSSLLSSVLINGKGWHFSPLIPSTEAPFDPTVPQNVTQFNVKHGKKYLFRIINGASISELQFFVHNHSQEIVEVDATRVKPVRSQNGLELNVGQRYSFILTANQSVGNYFIQVFFALLFSVVHFCLSFRSSLALPSLFPRSSLTLSSLFVFFFSFFFLAILISKSRCPFPMCTEFRFWKITSASRCSTTRARLTPSFPKRAGRGTGLSSTSLLPLT
jgi:FtsP/CotA-like multicopper oxidase with cupredoxin domain